MHRAFDDYLNIRIEKDEDVNNIILCQACRHVIAHRGAVVDERMMRQIRAAEPRTVKQRLKDREVVQFDSDEIRLLSDSISRYVNRLCDHLESQ